MMQISIDSADANQIENWLQQGVVDGAIGSIRTVMDIQDAALAGAHISTIPPQFLPKMVDQRYTRETVRQFVESVTRKSVAGITEAEGAISQ